MTAKFRLGKRQTATQVVDEIVYPLRRRRVSRKDGDLIFLTDNQVILGGVQNVLPIQCEQKNAPKCVPGEAEFIEANMLGFGDEIGAITNRITAQTELQSLFEPGSPEYERLTYRITAGQHEQQSSIDKMKGILAKPMPKYWYDEKAAEETGDSVNVAICASKKPYFMIYRYPELKNRYQTFLKVAEKKAVAQFGRRLNDVIQSEGDAEKQFTYWFNRLCPVQRGYGVVNQICCICEDYFAKYKEDMSYPPFDYSILKSGVEYSRTTKEKITALYHDYMLKLQSLVAANGDEEESVAARQMLKQSYEEACVAVCPDPDELCDIVVDICYSKEKSKQFAWSQCGETIVKNLLKRNGGTIWYPRQDKKGGVSYGGRQYALVEFNVESNGCE